MKLSNIIIATAILGAASGAMASTESDYKEALECNAVYVLEHQTARAQNLGDDALKNAYFSAQFWGIRLGNTSNKLKYPPAQVDSEAQTRVADLTSEANRYGYAETVDPLTTRCGAEMVNIKEGTRLSTLHAIVDQEDHSLDDLEVTPGLQ